MSCDNVKPCDKCIETTPDKDLVKIKIGRNTEWNFCKKCVKELRDWRENKQKKEPIHRCWYCGEEIIWQSDFNYDEVFGEGEGIVSYLHCPSCGAEIQYSKRTDEDDGST